MVLNTQRIMLIVLGALLPGVAAMTYLHGPGIVWNLVILTLACAATELLILRLKLGSWAASYQQLTDASTVLTAWLIAICLPPFVPAPMLMVAAFAAVGLAKHAYGGLGRNIFNPAMVGYAVILVAFPASLAEWPSPTANHTEGLDGLSGATLLSEFRYRAGLTVAEFDIRFAHQISQQRWVAAAFALGGAILLYLKVIAWRIPAAMFGAVIICALFGYQQGASTGAGGAWFHWTTGGFVAAAFFVATDPVTHPNEARHQIIFGAIVGVLIYVIRGYGSFPDGIAFAILLANCCTPLLNRISAQRAYTPNDRETAVNKQAESNMLSSSAKGGGLGD